MLPTFLNPALLGGLALVAIPVLIHLINMMRQRRVRWAAMDFLLVSQKKNRTFVLLKQLLLLLMRMAAVAAVALLLAQPTLNTGFGRMFGSATTHHIVLLDDSFSMSQRWGDTTAFEQAKQAVQRLVSQAADQGTAQQLTLVRFSQAVMGDQNVQADLNSELITVDFPERLETLLKNIEPSQLAVGPQQALNQLNMLLEQTDAQRRIVYLLSDFQAEHWSQPGELARQLEQLNQQGVTLELLRAVDRSRSNVAIEQLRPLGGNLAAGVPLMMEVTLRNYGDEPLRNVSVMLEEDGSPRPAVVMDVLPAGSTESRRFPVRFVTAGEHVVQARVESDTVEVDNQRWQVLDIPVTIPVLIIDGGMQRDDAEFLSLVFAPGGPVSTGIAAQIEAPEYLVDQPLGRYRVIYLCNVPRLTESAVAALEDYVREGGAVAFFTGPETEPYFYNELLYREGAGLFPAPLAGVGLLTVDRLETAPDLEVDAAHPVFSVFAGERNSFLSSVNVERYQQVAEDWAPAEGSATRVIATLRNGAPLAIEQPFGAGRVVALLTTAAPQWNNWGRNPSFVVAMLELQSYLAATEQGLQQRLVGQPLELKLDPATYQSSIRFVPPQQYDSGPVVVEAAASSSNGNGLSARFADTYVSGIYMAEISTLDGDTGTRRFAFNVDPREGNLASVDTATLAKLLPEVTYTMRQASDVQVATADQDDYGLGMFMLFALVGLLLGEQLLAYSASYHIKPSKVT